MANPKITVEKQTQEPLFFWLGAEGEIEELTKDQFEGKLSDEKEKTRRHLEGESV